MRNLLAALMLLACSALAFAKQPKPEDFTIDAEVSEIHSHNEVTGSTNSYRPAYCNSPKGSFQTAYCAGLGPGGSTADTENVSVMTTAIGDRIYELQGNRLNLGNYKARKAKRCPTIFKSDCQDGYEFLV